MREAKEGKQSLVSQKNKTPFSLCLYITTSRGSVRVHVVNCLFSHDRLCLYSRVLDTTYLPLVQFQGSPSHQHLHKDDHKGSSSLVLGNTTTRERMK